MPKAQAISTSLDNQEEGAERIVGDIGHNEASIANGEEHNARVLSILPIELWLEILHHATFVPDILAPDIYHQTRTLGAYFNLDHHPMMLDALYTKRSLVLVCKHWRGLCSSLLYQSIFIRDTKSLRALAGTLMRSHEESHQFSPGMGSLGSLTTRLDFAPTDWKPNSESDMTLLNQVIDYLPNLVIASFSMISQDIRLPAITCSVADSLISKSQHLRVIDWSTQAPVPVPRNPWFELPFIHNPQLRMLGCIDAPLLPAVPAPQAGGTRRSEDPFVRTNMRSLSIYGPFRDHGFCTYVTFPSLRELSCHLWKQSEGTAVAQERFFGRHGANLAALHLQNYTSSPTDNTRDMLWVKERCPALRNLTISVRDWRELPIDPANIPGIESLGLRCVREGLGLHQFKLLFSFIESLDAASSTLRVIQFLDPLNVANMLQLGGGRKFIRNSVSRFKFRLEDCAGRSLKEYL
ncbi:hypothetical protein HYDPIDRAFT_108333 [Hydnomerulius pinastri MD-312]|nr:hypothetical protein HYDPIDRAFT_108333 [Hydnomerulius pinastri MD-312]